MTVYREIPARSVLRPLVDALLGVSTLTELNGRNLVLRLVSDELGRPLSVAESPRATAHLLDIVDACRQCPDGLPALLRVLEYLEPGTSSVAAVRRVIVAGDLLDSWPTEERKELFLLLTGIEAADLAEVYRLAGGPAAPRLPASATCEEMFLALETLNSGPDGVPRTLVFLEQLAARARLDQAVELRHWVDRQVAKMHLVDELQEVRRRLTRAAIPVPRRSRSAAYVVFQLLNEGPNGNRFRLSHWRQLDVLDGWHPERGHDVTGTLAGIKRHVAEVVEGVEADWAHHVPDIRVEFVLPMRLLNLDVDQWQWETDTRLPQPIGCRFSVVVRSLDRMLARKWHRHWHARWRELRGQIDSAGGVTPDSGHWNRVRDQRGLRELTSRFESRPDIVALMLSAPPRRSGHFDELTVGLRAGIPIIVWHRTDCETEGFVATVTELLHGTGPNHPLDRIRLLRSGAFATPDDTPVGAALTVLWDDPERAVVPGPPALPEEVAGT